YNGDVIYSVKDYGSGIAREDQERIFERFYRVDKARSRGTGGSGLGLSIAREIAEDHQGKLTVDSTLGEGSTFTMVLPVMKEGPDEK
ncbi:MULTISPECIES: ATP-binding protein, partial [unclassified Oceanobacillus]|uniref:ATP-binding protein n=1 Tax=unclassified Oceanobacillus TaxID=2630292 RepID=UPI00300DF4CC